MDKIVIEKDGKEIEIPTKVVLESNKLKPLLNNDCWKIYSKLAANPGYPAELAKELGLSEQKVYYYIKQLKNHALIKIDKTEEVQGAVAKYYKASFDSFSLVPEETVRAGKNKMLNKREGGKAESFLSEFTRNGIFEGKIVVGSPDPHGPFKARARDGHLAAELSAFIASNTQGFELPLVYLDTMVADLKKENSNLIILGGPVTNKLAHQVNEHLPIKFIPNGGNWTITSEATKKEYFEDSIGVVEKIKHPYFKNRTILIVAGKRNTGTIAGIIALAKYTEEAIKPNIRNKEMYARVVEGLDLNGDGLIDEVEFRE
ncbi:MAG: hypothetical protein COV47_05210 [Candidatus Diapherotrites archaeon CG11_big_fil_rev_8_21_14_0_20_37_9]|nr:MAG: hypothetical protein COV47_05210 [Candidatus Diapherotrites archaeon CG11_big_fil_rev_8_21_14_0_20_37_9]